VSQEKKVFQYAYYWAGKQIPGTPSSVRMRRPGAEWTYPKSSVLDRMGREVRRGLELGHGPRIIVHAPGTLLIEVTSVKGIAHTLGILGRRALPSGRRAPGLVQRIMGTGHYVNVTFHAPMT
jgi:hypothetical protein